MKRRVLSAVMALSLLLATGANNVQAATTYYTDTEADHNLVNFSDMSVSNYTTEPLYDTIEQLSQAYAVSDNEEQVQELFDKLMNLVDQAYTVSAIYDINYYDDVQNEENSQLSADLSNELNTIYDEVMTCVDGMCDTEYASIAEEYFDTTASELSYEPMTDEEKALSEQETDLVQQYDTLIAEGFDDPDGEEPWYNQVAEIYIQLLDVRTQLASYYGYDSYMEYAYSEIYGRDYTVEEAAYYREYVKEYMVPLYDEILEEAAYVDELDDLYNLEAPTEEEILTKIGSHLSDISPELMTAYNALVDYHLYDIEALDTKMDMGYTTSLYQYRVPFLFNTPYNDFSDYTCTIHEFGHFNQMYHQASGALQEGSSYDVSEIHSQGLELLFLEYADDLYGENLAEADEIYEMYAMLSSVLDGCLYDEFQQEAFALDNPTVDDLTNLYVDLSEEYGYDVTSNETDKYDWVNISHTFESPFYYMSYSTSALGALEIYVLSLDDRQDAIDKYMTLTTVDDDMGLVEALATAGLDNVMEEDTIEQIAKNLEIRYVGTYSVKNRHSVAMLFAGGIAFALVVIVVVILILRGGKKSDEEELEEELEAHGYHLHHDQATQMPEDGMQTDDTNQSDEK